MIDDWLVAKKRDAYMGGQAAFQGLVQFGRVEICRSADYRSPLSGDVCTQARRVIAVGDGGMVKDDFFNGSQV